MTARKKTKSRKDGAPRRRARVARPKRATKAQLAAMDRIIAESGVTPSAEGMAQILRELTGP